MNSNIRQGIQDGIKKNNIENITEDQKRMEWFRLNAEKKLRDANHFKITNNRTIQINKKTLGERSKKRVFEDLYTSKYEKDFNLKKLQNK